MTSAAAWVRSRTHNDAAVESAYERYIERTWANWSALYSFFAVGQPKIAESTKLLGDWVFAFDFPVLFIPFLAIVLGLTRARDAFLIVLRGRSSWTTAIFLGFACGAISYVLITIASRITIEEVGGELVPERDLGLGAGVYFLTSVVGPATIEEFIFQVGLQTRLNRYGATTSILVTTIVFNLYHLEHFDRLPTMLELVEIAPLFFGLLINACLRRWNGSLVAVVIAHGFSNWLYVVLGPQR